MLNKLVLFFTYGQNLDSWSKQGTLNREITFYKQLIGCGFEVEFFTFGNKSELDFNDFLYPVKVIPAYASVKPKKNPKLRFLQSFLLPFKLRKMLVNASILKSNQMMGAWIPLILKWLLRKPLVLRCGFEHYFTIVREGRSIFERGLFYLYSKLMYFFCDRIIVTSPWIADYIVKTFKIKRNKICIVPNYIDTSLFIIKEPTQPQRNRVIFIGRLSREKNLLALIEACKLAGMGLDIIGCGNEEKALRDKTNSSALDVKFLGMRPNNELPDLLANYRIFVLPSLYEGNPKVLLEAMSCGLAVIATNNEGSRLIIEDGYNGLLCGPSVQQLTSLLLKLKNDYRLQERIGQAARRTIVQNYSLERIVAKEISVYNEILE